MLMPPFEKQVNDPIHSSNQPIYAESPAHVQKQILQTDENTEECKDYGDDDKSHMNCH